MTCNIYRLINISPLYTHVSIVIHVTLRNVHVAKPTPEEVHSSNIASRKLSNALALNAGSVEVSEPPPLHVKLIVFEHVASSVHGRLTVKGHVAAMNVSISEMRPGIVENEEKLIVPVSSAVPHRMSQSTNVSTGCCCSSLLLLLSSELELELLRLFLSNVLFSSP